MASPRRSSDSFSTFPGPSRSRNPSFVLTHPRDPASPSVRQFHTHESQSFTRVLQFPPDGPWNDKPHSISPMSSSWSGEDIFLPLPPRRQFKSPEKAYAWWAANSWPCDRLPVRMHRHLELMRTLTRRNFLIRRHQRHIHRRLCRPL